MITYDKIELWHLEKNHEGDMVPARLGFKQVTPYDVNKPPQIVKYKGNFYVYRRLPEYFIAEVYEVVDPPEPTPEITEPTVADMSVMLKSKEEK